MEAVRFQLEEHKVKDLKLFQQFEMCLLATRLTTTELPIEVLIPKTYYYPDTWEQLEPLGVKFTRQDEVEDQTIKGTHVAVCSLAKLYYPNIPQCELLPPDELCTFEEAIHWLEQNRTNNDKIWLPMNPHNPHYWNSRPQTTRLPMLEWLQWAYWRRSQPNIHYGTRTIKGFEKKNRIYPPGRGI